MFIGKNYQKIKDNRLNKMPKKRGSSRTFNKKDYDLIDDHPSKRKANSSANKIRVSGNRAIVDEGKKDGKKAFFVYKRKGARDPL